MIDAPIAELLVDIRGLMGADAAVVWRVVPGGAPSIVWFATADSAAPTLDEKQRGIVKWAADQVPGEVSSDGDPVCFVAAPIASKLSSCVLAVYGPRSLSMAKAECRRWMPRFAARVGTIMDLVEKCDAATRTERQTTILLNAATQPHDNRTIDVLGERVCNAACEMTGAKRAALIHWHAHTREGEVAYATRGHLVSAGSPVDAVSQTGAACESDFVVILEDAKDRGQTFLVYGGTEIARSIGSLAIIPLRGCDGVIGALVIEGDQPRQITSEDGKNLRLLGLLTAASLETVWEIDQINKLARTDALTGLANRQAFEERLGKLIAETNRFGGSGALVVVDVDHFKHVNDTYGHHAGDVVLQRISQMLMEATRSVDLCARYGGEELALLLPQTTSAGACQLAERLRKRVAGAPIVVDGREIEVTISLGVASYPQGARNRDELFAAADRALYMAKRAGRNRVIADAV